MTEDHDAELEAITAELEAAGPLTVTTDDDGSVTYALTGRARPSAGSRR